MLEHEALCEHPEGHPAVVARLPRLQHFEAELLGIRPFPPPTSFKKSFKIGFEDIIGTQFGEIFPYLVSKVILEL